MATNRQEADRRVEDLRHQLAATRERDPRLFPAEVVLERGPGEVRTTIARILRIPDTATPAEAVKSLGLQARSALRKLTRRRPRDYRDVVVLVASRAKLPSEGPTWQIEEQLVVRFFNEAWRRMSEPEQRALRDRLATVEAGLPTSLRSGRKQGASLLIGAAGIAAAQASGFGVYLAATSTLAALSGAVGVTVPFAAYAGLSSVIATLIGPIGWAVLAAGAVAYFLRPDVERLGRAVLVIASARASLRLGWETEMEQLESRLREAEAARDAIIESDEGSTRRRGFPPALGLALAFLIAATAFAIFLAR